MTGIFPKLQRLHFLTTLYLRKLYYTFSATLYLFSGDLESARLKKFKKFGTKFRKIAEAEKMFQKAMEILKDSDSYNKIRCLQLYGDLISNTKDREKEGKLYIDEAH